MKKTISAFFITVSMAVMFLVACSDDSSDETLPREIITKVNSIYELGKCGDQNEGDTVYAQKEDADYYCHNENWIPVNESSSSAKSTLYMSILALWKPPRCLITSLFMIS